MTETASSTAPQPILVTLSGVHTSRSLSKAMHVLSVPSTMHDLGQLVVRDRFITTALLHPPPHAVKDILFRAQRAQLQLHLDVPPAPTPHPSRLEHFVLTLICAPPVPPALLLSVTRVLEAHSARIVNINRLSLENDELFCLEFRLTVDALHLPQLQKQLFLLGRTQGCDLALQRADISRRAKRIIVFDLSWTLIQCDAVNILLQAAGKTLPQSVEDAFKNGKLSQSEYLRERVKLLKGLDESEINQQAIANIVYTKGAVQLCNGLKTLGCKLALVSSGSKAICDAAKAHLGLDFCFGNVLEVDTAGRFTGCVTEPVIDMQRKAELVQMLAMQERIDLEQMVAVGDGPVSSKMLGCVGMSIAFDQPEQTGNVHSGVIGCKSLASVLYLLGVGGDDFKTVIRRR